MNPLLTVAIVAWIIYLVVKRELHLGDRPDTGIVKHYNVMIAVSIAILVFYFVLAWE